MAPKCVVAALTIAMLVATPADAQSSKHELVGQWGPYAEPDPPPKADSPEQRLTYIRRQQMRAISAHYRTIEAALHFDARASVPPTADADALARIGENLPRLFALRSPHISENGAKAAIWEEPQHFGEHLAGFRGATHDLAGAARGDDRTVLASALEAVRYQCLACHFHYRRIEGRSGVEGRRTR